MIEDVESWNPNLCSKAAIRSSDTRYFVDPSLAAASLGIGPNDLLNNPKTFGFLFETLCIRDLRVYASALNGKIYHYRDSYGLECDAVLHRRDGSYGLIEIKLGGERLIEEGAKTLKKLSDTIDTTKMKEPAFLMVRTCLFNGPDRSRLLCIPKKRRHLCRSCRLSLLLKAGTEAPVT